MADLLNWFTEHESALSGIAAMIAIIAGIAVVARLAWTRMPSQVMSQVKRPAFLSDWRNVGLIGLAGVALILALILGLGNSDSDPLDHTSTGISGKPSVAVLPLNYISDDTSKAFLADAITEDVITLLSHNPRFFVIARNSTFAYKGQSPDIRQVGEELGVRYVVEGSVRKNGEQLRVTVQLIDTTNGQHLWAEQYDRPFAEIYDLQDEITNGIAAALGDQIFTAEIARAHSKPTDNLDAWGLVMRANRGFVHFNRASSHQAIKDLRAALTLDPEYALAKAELSYNLCANVISSFSDNPNEDMAEAYTLAAEALRERPDDPLVLSRAATCYGLTGRREDGIRLMEKALVKQPNNALALWTMGAIMVLDGQAAAALAKLNQAIELSPRAPEMYFIQMFQAVALADLERYTEAEQVSLSGLQVYDGWHRSWMELARVRADLGDVKGAQQALYKAREIEPSFSLMSLKKSYALIFKDKGRLALSNLEPIWPEDLLTSDKK